MSFARSGKTRYLLNRLDRGAKILVVRAPETVEKPKKKVGGKRKKPVKKASPPVLFDLSRCTMVTPEEFLRRLPEWKGFDAVLLNNLKGVSGPKPGRLNPYLTLSRISHVVGADVFAEISLDGFDGFNTEMAVFSELNARLAPEVENLITELDHFGIFVRFSASRMLSVCENLFVPDFLAGAEGLQDRLAAEVGTGLSKGAL